jgi:hypothetical protein
LRERKREKGGGREGGRERNSERGREGEVWQGEVHAGESPLMLGLSRCPCYVFLLQGVPLLVVYSSADWLHPKVGVLGRLL